MKEALFCENIGKKNIVKCTLCPLFCMIQEGKVGACAIRQNRNGKLYTLVYGKVIASHADPIEKKPLFHFMPGSKIYSYATAGCNFKCNFCQNWEISQVSKGLSGKVIGEEKTPKEIVQDAIRNGCNSIAMTYNEPSIQLEFALDVCKEAKKKKLFTVFVSNGFICKEPIDMIAQYLDAINIDLKAFTDEFYMKICGAKISPVLEAIKYYHKKKVWTEITTLVIPGENDSDEELKKIAKFIVKIDRNIPWHISRFHPDYKMKDKRWTAIETLHKAYGIGKEAGLKYVYVGNVVGDKNENTCCPKCSELLIERYGFEIMQMNLEGNKCRKCKEVIAGKY